MVMKLDPRRCSICGRHRGFTGPDHSNCARQKQQDNSERNAKREPRLKRVRDQARANYMNPKTKRWWPD